MLTKIVISMTLYFIALSIAQVCCRAPQKKSEKGYEVLDGQNTVKIIELYVSLIHSSITSILMFYSYCIYDHEMIRPIGYVEEIAISHTIGCTIYNFYPHYINNTLDMFIIWHHLCSMFILRELNQWIY